MAEVFGLAAAGIGVAPIAFELAKTAKKLKDYCRDVKSASEDIQSFVDEVEALQMVLVQLEGLGIMDCRSSSQALQRCHDLCAKANNTLSSIVSELQEGLKTHCKRVQWAFPLKKEKVKQLTEKVASAKSSLLLACNVYLMWQTKIQAAAQQQLIAEVYATVQAHRDDHSRTFNDLVSGNLAIRQSLHSLIAAKQPRSRGENANRNETRAMHVLNGVWNALSILSLKGCTRPLRTYRIVGGWSDDPAGRAVRHGDLESLQRLICAGEASIHDMEKNGQTLLSYTAFYCQRYIFRWLCEMGADAGASFMESSDLLSFYMWNGLTFENTNSLAELNEDARFICDNFEFGDDDEKLGEMRPSGIDHHLHSLAKPIEHWNGDDVQFVAQFSFARPVFQRMEYWESLLELIEKQRWTFEEWQYRDIDGDSLVHGLAIWYARASLSDLDLSTMLAKYLKVLLRNGVDLHAVSGPAEETPLAALCVAGLNYGFNTERMANPTLQSWLYHLAAEGIDLAKYGEVEERLWRRRLRTTDRGMRMIGLAYGPRAQDWFIWTEHPGDSYAGIFWDLIEHPERRVPGAWQDCDEWLWEDEYFAELESERHYRKYLYQKELESRQQAVVEEVED